MFVPSTVAGWHLPSWAITNFAASNFAPIKKSDLETRPDFGVMTGCVAWAKVTKEREQGRPRIARCDLAKQESHRIDLRHHR